MKAKSTPPDPENPCSLAIIEGVLCRLNRKGRPTSRYQPVGTAIEEFIVLPDGGVLVRELSYGFLPGISNLYCLDEKLRLRWLAELPAQTDFYETISEPEGKTVTWTTRSGLAGAMDWSSGRLSGSRAKSR